MYADLDAWKQRQEATEEAWPEYIKALDLVSKRAYVSGDGDSESWLHSYLYEHVQRMQELKQHHVHTLNSKGERVPLTHCRRPDDPRKCKGDFSRTLWLIDKAVIPCQGLLKRMGMACSGRQNKLGALHGPRVALQCI